MIQFTLNGKRVRLDVPADMPLLWAIRDHANLTGTKFGCGIGQCGACTVHLDGAPVRSCQLPVSAVAGKAITTIEGVSAPATALPAKDRRARAAKAVQSAWTRLDVVQCGYCQSGQIMSAVALLADNPSPTDADIDTAMAGNVCRCATYHRIRAAIHEAARDLSSAKA